MHVNAITSKHHFPNENVKSRHTITRSEVLWISRFSEVCAFKILFILYNIWICSIFLQKWLRFITIHFVSNIPTTYILSCIVRPRLWSSDKGSMLLLLQTSIYIWITFTLYFITSFSQIINCLVANRILIFVIIYFGAIVPDIILYSHKFEFNRFIW